MMIFIKRVSIFLGIVCVATSCYQYNKPDKPKDLIPKDQMVNILIDIKLLTSSNGKNKIILEDNNLFSEAYIYRKYNIDSLRFANSNNYYSYYTEEYNEIYSKIKDSLEKLQIVLKELDKKEEEEKAERIKAAKKKEKDSLNPLKFRDSLKRVNDSIKNLAVKEPIDEGLITPVSDTDTQ